MSVVETIAALNHISEVSGMFMNMWVSFTFGYLTVAYFLDTVLTRFQCLCTSVLYAVTASYAATAVIARVHGWHEVRTRSENLYDNIQLMTSEAGWEWGFIFFLTLGTSTSLYFMCDVRRRGMTRASQDCSRPAVIDV